MGEALVPADLGVLPSMNPEAIDRVRRLMDFAMSPDVEAAGMVEVHIPIEDLIRWGLYFRTAYQPARTTMIGVPIRVPTTVIVQGDAWVYIGEDKPLFLPVYNVLRGAPGRQQVFYAQTDLKITMIFPTAATTVEEAENEFTAEPHLLQSRRGL